MALPVTISGVQFPDQNYYCGPFLSGGAFYAVFRENSTPFGDIIVMKATDPTDSFSEQDSGNRPSVPSAKTVSMWAYQDGTDLHIVHMDNVVDIVRYSVFHMATDLWDGTIVNQTVENTSPPIGVTNSVSIALRSDGDVIVLYTGNADNVHGADRARVDYAREEGSGWTVGIAVDNAGAEDWVGSVIVPGSSDRMHFFFKNDAQDDAYQRTLLSDNSLETFPSAGDTATAATNHVFGPGISYDDGGTQRIRCLYEDGSGKISYAEFDSADAPGVFTVNADVSDNTVKVVNESPVASLAVDGTDEHLLYSNSADADLFHDKNDGTDTEILDGVTINRVSNNVYDRTTNTRLAYVYDDAGTIKYNELDLGALGEYLPIDTAHQPHHQPILAH